MGCGSSKVPKEFMGPYIIIGDSKGDLKQYALINNKLTLAKKYYPVHTKEGGGITTIGMFASDEYFYTKDNKGNFNKWATQRQLRLWEGKEIVMVKVISCICNTSDDRFGFLATKFGKIDQWCVYKKQIFNIWHIVTSGRAITAMHSPKIIVPEHQVENYYDHT